MNVRYEVRRSITVTDLQSHPALIASRDKEDRGGQATSYVMLVVQMTVA